MRWQTWKVLGEDKMLGNASRHCLVNINGQQEGLEGRIASPLPHPSFPEPDISSPDPLPQSGPGTPNFGLCFRILCSACHSKHTPHVYTHQTPTQTHTHTTQNHPGPCKKHSQSPLPQPKHPITILVRSGVNLITVPWSAWHGALRLAGRALAPAGAREGAGWAGRSYF